MWETIKGWFKNSLTLVWARLQYIGSIIVAGLVATFGDYDFKTLATMTSLDALHILGALVITGIMTEFCRRRTL